MDAIGLLLDPGITIAVQNFSPALTRFVSPGDFLDSTPWYLLIISVIYLGLHPRYGIRLAVLFGITAGLNEALKLAWHLPRPYWISPEVKVFANHPSFGFPSGGAMYGAVIYGYIAAAVRRWWAILLCALLLVAACVSRVFVGAHFVPDIFGGLLFGFLLLLVFFLAGPRIETYAATLSRPGRCIGIIILAAVPLILVIPAYLSLAGWQLPASWVELAFRQTGLEINPVSIQFAWGATGIILGSLTGYEVLLSQGGWAPPADLKQRCAVILAGTASVLTLFAIVTTARSAADLSFPFTQCAQVLSMIVVLFWLTCCVPLIFRRAGFSQEECTPEAGAE
jgi:membrane-associated phospholipid phosphatase